MSWEKIISRATLSYLVRYPEFTSVTKGRPELGNDWIVADLHAHPYLRYWDDFLDTIRAMKRNKVDMLGLTVHHQRDNGEVLDYWDIKKQILHKSSHHRKEHEFHDLGLLFRYDGKIFSPAYEVKCKAANVEGEIDILVLMPDKEFEENLPKEMFILDLVGTYSYGGILVGAHPYIKHAPYKMLFNSITIPFSPVSEPEREFLLEERLGLLNGVESVSAQVAWTMEDEMRLMNDYGKGVLASSDAHGKRYIGGLVNGRREIGRSVTMFKKDILESNKGREIRTRLADAISANQFRTHTSKTPPLTFLLTVYLNPYRK